MNLKGTYECIKTFYNHFICQDLTWNKISATFGPKNALK